MSREKILIVEDDPNISQLVKYNLEKTGYTCILSTTGEAALRILNKENNIDLIILDIMLPEMDGFEVCRRIKQNQDIANLPIIMLTAKGEEIDRIVGLELGADDYVVKPFSPRELILRIKAILKRGKIPDIVSDVLIAAKLKVDISKHKVTFDDTPIELTPMEFKLLVTLMKRKGRVQSRHVLLSDVWDMGSDVTTRTIDTHIKRLREKLSQAGIYIETVRGLGYRFSEEV